MDSHPDSPDSLPSDQLTVDLLSSRAKRRRILINDVRRGGTTDINNKNNNNDVDFVLMDDEHHENGEDEVRIYFKGYPAFSVYTTSDNNMLIVGAKSDDTENPKLDRSGFMAATLYTLREGFLVYLGQLSNLPV